MKKQFTWVLAHKAIARKLSEYEHRQSELIKHLQYLNQNAYIRHLSQVNISFLSMTNMLFEEIIKCRNET